MARLPEPGARRPARRTIQSPMVLASHGKHVLHFGGIWLDSSRKHPSLLSESHLSSVEVDEVSQLTGVVDLIRQILPGVCDFNSQGFCKETQWDRQSLNPGGDEGTWLSLPSRIIKTDGEPATVSHKSK